jgi:hypothetical protein
LLLEGLLPSTSSVLPVSDKWKKHLFPSKKSRPPTWGVRQGVSLSQGLRWGHVVVGQKPFLARPSWSSASKEKALGRRAVLGGALAVCPELPLRLEAALPLAAAPPLEVQVALAPAPEAVVSPQVLPALVVARAAAPSSGAARAQPRAAQAAAARPACQPRAARPAPGACARRRGVSRNRKAGSPCCCRLRCCLRA